MKTVSSALKAHLAQQYQTMATCWQATLVSGTKYRFTDHDKDLVISGWSAPDNILHGTYAAATGFSAKAIATSDALNVDNTEAESILNSASITESDLLAGRWDNASIIIFQVNWADLTMGPLYQRAGWIGEVSSGRTMFRAEIRGLMQRYTGTLCELTSVACRANFGDARCKVVLTGYTVTGTLTSVNADNMTLYDTSRVESGPTGGVGITGITKANPGVVTIASDIALADGQVGTISGVGGMLQANTMVRVRNPSGLTFQIGDTSSFSTYTSGGTFTPAGASASRFDGGTITFTSGLNNGLSFEVKAYVPGQITLYQALPFLAATGNTYSLVQGCGKDLYADCRDRFNNVVNFRGEPFVPGFDRMVQVGRSGM